VVLDPLNPASHQALAFALFYARRYAEAITASEETLRVVPDHAGTLETIGLTYYLLGDLPRARLECERASNHPLGHGCLAIVLHKLGQGGDAAVELAKLQNTMGEGAAYQYVQIYAQWGDTSKALDWLDVALRVKDAGLSEIRMDPLVDPLRNSPRFAAIQRALRFPD
jgi:tetratricopeptide (TPR) repeat protein